jgi:radical SAM protein with 4Fe4S-binding SPASM domain
MPLDQFERVINQFPSLQSLSLHGIGEPLMHPQLVEMIAVAAARGIKVRFTTNATLLARERSERLIASGLRQLIISVDGATAKTYEAIRQGARFEVVIENIQALSRAKREMKSATPLIYFNMVVCRTNHHETAQLVDLAQRVSADCVVLSPMQPPLPALAQMACSPEQWQAAVSVAKARARSLGINLYARRDGKPAAGGQAKKTYRCLEPWRTAVVLMNGDVMPCCNIHDSDFGMGNLFDQAFTEVWNGSAYQAFRSDLKQKGQVPKPCRWCPDF